MYVVLVHTAVRLRVLYSFLHLLQQSRVEISEELLRGSQGSTVTKDVFGVCTRDCPSR